MRQLSYAPSVLRCSWPGLALLLALLAGSRPALAAPRRAAIAPLGLLGISATEAQRVQRWLHGASLRLPGFRWTSTAVVSRALADRRACLKRSRCLANLLRELDLRLIVRGEVGSIGGAYFVYLHAIDRSGVKRGSVSGLLDPAASRPERAALELLYRLLLPNRHVGSLKIEADVDGAWIYLDGTRVARSPVAVLDNVDVGKHALRITHEAYRDYVRFVRVDFQRQTQVTAALSAFPIHAKEMRLDDPERKALRAAELPWYRRWWAVGGFGVLVVAATTTVVALIPRPVSRDRDLTVLPPER